VRAHGFGGEAAAELVFLNGRLVRELSSFRELPPGARVSGFGTASPEEEAELRDHLGRYADFEARGFVAWNTAFVDDGALVFIPRAVAVPKPIHLLHVTTGEGGPTVSHPRNLLLLEEGAEARVIETYVSLGDAPCLTNAVTEALVGRRASLGRVALQNEGPGAFHMAAFQARQAEESALHALALGLGARLSRTETGTTLDGERSACTLDGLYLGRDDQLIDNHTVIRHARPDCSSRELYKGILTGRSRGVFSGRIVVSREAQKTDAKQTSQALLLSPDAAAHAKPQLEIYADDVKCTHGTTVGRLDEDALFYLRSRGIDEKAARSLLVFAFASELVGRIDFAPLRSRLEETLITRLPEGGKIRGVV
jgi:Fe-S cluster assembly protein SufD